MHEHARYAARGLCPGLSFVRPLLQVVFRSRFAQALTGSEGAGEVHMVKATVPSDFAEGAPIHRHILCFSSPSFPYSCPIPKLFLSTCRRPIDAQLI